MKTSIGKLVPFKLRPEVLAQLDVLADWLEEHRERRPPRRSSQKVSRADGLRLAVDLAGRLLAGGQVEHVLDTFPPLPS